MKSFEYYLETISEIGFVEKLEGSIVTVKGLPNAKPSEVVLFETGEAGQVISLGEDSLEVMLFTYSYLSTGVKVARTDQYLEIALGPNLLGKTINPLGHILTGKLEVFNQDTRPIDTIPAPISDRQSIDKSFFTGVSWVDLVIPLGKGQRQLVIGDRKIGKTQFLFQALQSGARQGMVCIYAVIGKRSVDIKDAQDFLESNNITSQVIVVSSSASDAPGLIYLTPFTAMTIAEYFRDQGRDVLIILDDMIAHAKYYREISLLARRFPGRSSYPGDIFYVQARLLERAGNFKTGSITCLPVAELTMGDLTGYIPTNLMAITDGHILFDHDYYNQGRRPAINPFLSVTRVGRQTQSILMQELNNKLTSFLVQLSKIRQFMHFGAELSEITRNNLILGDKIEKFLEQLTSEIRPININLFLLASFWAGIWKTAPITSIQPSTQKAFMLYEKDTEFTQKIDNLISTSQNLDTLTTAIKTDPELINSLVGEVNA
ncbi:hypothetical protein A2382_02035 [Candidatus Woesebacteria bacterium RIFOXYB1_FULL_38_16]|uniref:ATPase F1/V1/A1 complex alpha/beta subunit nucleotide-binding domain-containing protein n=1 Tax=Candidatus Woesebacteria bacterium RIFOXYB1_FULL_38_16 TaxID=1802538 RepID=A0A1F8CVB2_9BACT|nr:MAG: hypothetical protein A2191_04855 [Candidatus Woesebacteria bacterium RIFOXYA1_FULL_38_9]OGM79678.1 MAG: hypothetical protein A2382_02035 [Candidatus Woesebacteria bacterium RIFOXYB1_FULL_38_16]